MNLRLSDYSPAPFWFLNHRLEEPELARQLDLMKQQGVTAFFMHPRAGLETPYGSDDFFSKIRFIVAEAEKRGMKAWLYDEDPFPSGAAGGRITIEHPEFRARGLQFRESDSGEVRFGEETFIEAVAVKRSKSGVETSVRDVSKDVGILRETFISTPWKNPYYIQLAGKTVYNHRRAETFYPGMIIRTALRPGEKLLLITAKAVTDTKYRWLPDNMNPECAKEFIRLTHEKYFEYLDGKCGKTVPGIFTDETAAGGAIPWTPEIGKVYKKRFGEKLRWHELFTGSSEKARKTRLNYWTTVQDMFIRAFFKPVNDWCKSHQLLLCGHGIGEEDPLSTSNGMSIYQLQKYVGIPGFDHITPNIPDGRSFTSLNLGGKLVSSAAEQNGKRRVMSECFGCNPYNFGPDGMRRNFNWLASLGINWLVPHGFHYSFDGFRKEDAGRSFFFQSGDYREFHRFADYTSRIGHMLGNAESEASLCVLYPNAFFRSLMPGEHELASEYREKLFQCNQALINAHIQFEYADEISVNNAEKVRGGFKIGEKVYTALLLPFDMKWNGRISALKYPEAMKKLRGRDGFTLSAENGFDPAMLMTLLKRNSEGRVLFAFNNTFGSTVVRLEAENRHGIFLYDADSDSYSRLKDGKCRIDGAAAAMFFIPDSEFKAGKYSMPAPREGDFEYLRKPELEYMPPDVKVLAAVRDWKVRFGRKSFGPMRFPLMRDFMGYETQRMFFPVLDTANPVRSVYPAKAVFRAEFTLAEKASEMLFERDTFAGQCTVLLDGKAVSAPERRLVYDAWNMVSAVNLAPGKHTLEVYWENAVEFDGLRSLIYFL